MTTMDERNVDPLDEMTRIGQIILDLPPRGFIVSYHSVNPASLIYDSQWCRIKLIWGGWDYMEGNSIYIQYGRLHASNERATMPWKGEECHCWHDFDNALYFLDGREPAEAVELHFSHPITDPFYTEEVRQRFDGRQPEWLAQMQVAIWQHYGMRFFELFDLRQPDLWEQYRTFLKGFYDIKGRSPAIKPSPDKVC